VYLLSQLSSAHQEEVKLNRKYLCHIIDIVLYLCKQGMAFQGHDVETDPFKQGMVIIKILY